VGMFERDPCIGGFEALEATEEEVYNGGGFLDRPTAQEVPSVLFNTS
jgi:hypothetical protein